MHVILRSRRLKVAAATSLAALAAFASPSGAVHWPLFGGDAGRSGYQPVDNGTGPLDALYAKTGAEDANVVTSIITSAGPSTVQRFAYGTADGVVHVRMLNSGAPVGSAAGIDVSSEPNAFGDGAIGSVTFGETSSGAALGQVFALHNDASGVSIAQIDETTGGLVQDVAVAAAAGYDVNSSVLLTGAAADGSRALLFVAENTAGIQALFRVPISSAATTGATIGSATMTGDINATPEASPTLAFLENPASGSVGAFVAVGTLDGKVRTFAASDLSIVGPSEQIAGPDDVVMTPSVPVANNGMPPGVTGSGAARAPFLYAATTANATFSNPTTTVRRLTQAGAAFTVASSMALAGAASSALAIDQEVVAGVTTPGRVFVATESNLYALASADLSVAARLSPADNREGGLSGFSATVPAAGGDLVFVVTDGGQPLVLDAATLQPVSAGDFTANPAHGGSAISIGQPSLSRQFVQFASDKGVFVYKFRNAAPSSTTPPPAGASEDGYWLVGSDGGIFTFGDADFFGSTGGIPLNKPVVGMASTPTDNGYWLVASDGGIFSFGDAAFFGSTGDIVLNKPVVGMASTPTGKGYWLVASDGGIFSFGDAAFFGSTGGIPLNKPVVGMASTPTGKGYWLVASDGGIFSFGDAAFFGSTGGFPLNQPVVGMASTSTGNGYWLVASDGGIFAFGDAAFRGSTGGMPLNKAVVGMSAISKGVGYRLVASDGGIFTFGDATFRGSTGDLALNRPIVGMAATL